MTEPATPAPTAERVTWLAPQRPVEGGTVNVRPATRERNPAPPHTHAVCGATWTGSRACHCSGCCRNRNDPRLRFLEEQ